MLLHKTVENAALSPVRMTLRTPGLSRFTLVTIAFVASGCELATPVDRSKTPDSGITGDDDEDGFFTPDDCNDGNAAVHPDAAEVCDGVDNNCDGETDEGLAATRYVDADGDGYGAGTGAAVCPGTSGYADHGDDCDDAKPNVNPAATEICDRADNNCDGQTDEGLTLTRYADGDGDGFGAGDAKAVCVDGAGYSEVGTDCNDTNTNVNPDASEVCDGMDNDCDDEVDEEVTPTWYADMDGDGFGSASMAVSTCDAPSGYLPDGTDCDDDDRAVNPSAAERCDALDNNCDGAADEGGVCSTGPTWSVFVLSGGHMGGDFGGVSGADTLCQSEALVNGHAGTFKAWMSDASHSPAADFTHRATPYALPSGTQIAADWADLIDGTLDAAIGEYADGSAVGGYPAWTGTDYAGNLDTDTCSDWATSSSGWSGTNGYTASVDTGWTMGTTVCGNYALIYCFEQ